MAESTHESGFTSKIKEIYNGTELVKEAFTPMSVSITLEDDIDVSRGDMLTVSNNLTEVGQDIEVKICWLNKKPLNVGGKYILRHTTNEVTAIVKTVSNKFNINTLESIENDTTIEMNDIGQIVIKLAKPICFDSYTKNRGTGSIILVDPFTFETVGAGMIV